MHEIIKIEKLKKIFKTGSEELHILNNLDLNLEEGKKLVITGESGCGKSTLLNIIGGLDSPSAGSVAVDNYDVGSITENELYSFRNRVIGFIFQFHYLLKELSAVENVMLPCFIAGTPRKEALDNAYMLLKKVNLENRASHYPYQLSGGERQRAAVARAMINNPRVILADEPTGNLDEYNSKNVEDLLFSLAAENGTTLVLVTHEAGLADKGDIRMVLEKGRLEAL